MKKSLVTAIISLILVSPIIYYFSLHFVNPTRFPLETKYFLQVIFSVPVMLNADNTAGPSMIYFLIKNFKLNIPTTPGLSQNQRVMVLFSSPVLIALFILLIAKIYRSKSDSTIEDPPSPRLHALTNDKKLVKINVSKIIFLILSISLLLSSVFLIYKSMSNKSSPNKLPLQEIIQTPTTYSTPSLTPKTTTKPPIIPSSIADDQVYACDLGGACNSYLDPVSSGCPITFTDRFCDNKCSDPSVRCNN